MSLKTLVLMKGLLPKTYIAEMPLRFIRKADLFFSRAQHFAKNKPLPYSRLLEILKRKEHWQWH